MIFHIQKSDTEIILRRSIKTPSFCAAKRMFTSFIFEEVLVNDLSSVSFIHQTFNAHMQNVNYEAVSNGASEGLFCGVSLQTLVPKAIIH